MGLTTNRDQLLYSTVSMTFGCDPEFFFEREGRIVGAEKVMPVTGTLAADRYTDSDTRPHGTNKSAFVLDGVQIELNPSPHSCRANLGAEIGAAFRALRAHLQGVEGVKPSFNAVVKIEKAELNSLCEKAKVFGCEPSLNKYDGKAKVRANARTYLKRAAGGHIHLGLGSVLMQERERMVPLLDVLLGNTCVMLDRDPGAAERRKHYGRAGEYRLPKHGLEYRTLSNFWLRSYPLMHLVLGISRLTGAVLSHSRGVGAKFDFESKLLGMVDIEKVRKAINQNNLQLAKENWQAVREFLLEHVPQQDMGLDSQKVAPFEFFAKKIEENGLEYWFPEDPMAHWCQIENGHGRGIEAYWTYTVMPEMTGGRHQVQQ